MLKNLSSLMVYTHDMSKSVAFYRDTLGFKLDMESPFWSQFDLGGGLILGLHCSNPDTPQPVWSSPSRTPTATSSPCSRTASPAPTSV